MVLIIAHRGDSAHRPENTIASFASALDVGATLLEFDVQLTADGEVVVIHDPFLDRTTSGLGDVRQMTLTEIRAVSAGYPKLFGNTWADERISTLGEVLAFVRDRAQLLVEIKTDSVTDNAKGGIEARTITEIRRAGLASSCSIISFDQRALARTRSLAPEIVRGHLFGRATVEEMMVKSLQAECEIVMPHKKLLSEALAARVHDAGLKLATWVVDEPEELLALAPFGLYGVGTNRPGVLIEAMASGLFD